MVVPKSLENRCYRFLIIDICVRSAESRIDSEIVQPGRSTGRAVRRVKEKHLFQKYVKKKVAKRIDGY